MNAKSCGAWNVAGAMLLALAGSPQPMALAASPPGVADAVAVIEVSFVPYGNLVLLREMLRGDSSGIKNPEDFLGPCLPGKAAVRDLAARGDAQAAVYQTAIERAGYTAVIFLKRDADAFRPQCEDGHADARHWEQHPEHGAWRKALGM